MKKKCTYCSGKIKPGQVECYKCRNTRRAAINGLSAPEYSRDIAIDHISKKPGILKQIFGL